MSASANYRDAASALLPDRPQQLSFTCCGLTIARLTTLLALALFVIAVSTDQWLFTRDPKEIKVEPMENETFSAYRFETLEHYILLAHIGLFRACFGDKYITYDQYMCYRIDYMQSYQKVYVGEVDITLSIARDSRVACLVLFGAGLLLSIGLAMSFARRNTARLVAAFLVVIAGIVTMSGILVFIMAIDFELALRHDKQRSDLAFTYNYGGSFYAISISFVATELGGMLLARDFFLTLRENELIMFIPGLHTRWLSAMYESPDTTLIL